MRVGEVTRAIRDKRGLVTRAHVEAEELRRDETSRLAVNGKPARFTVFDALKRRAASACSGVEHDEIGTSIVARTMNIVVPTVGWILQFHQVDFNRRVRILIGVVELDNTEARHRERIREARVRARDVIEDRGLHRIKIGIAQTKRIGVRDEHIDDRAGVVAACTSNAAVVLRCFFIEREQTDRTTRKRATVEIAAVAELIGCCTNVP